MQSFSNSLIIRTTFTSGISEYFRSRFGGSSTYKVHDDEERNLWI